MWHYLINYAKYVHSRVACCWAAVGGQKGQKKEKEKKKPQNYEADEEAERLTLD